VHVWTKGEGLGTHNAERWTLDPGPRTTASEGRTQSSGLWQRRVLVLTGPGMAARRSRLTPLTGMYAIYAQRQEKIQIYSRIHTHTNMYAHTHTNTHTCEQCQMSCRVRHLSLLQISISSLPSHLIPASRLHRKQLCIHSGWK